MTCPFSCFHSGIQRLRKSHFPWNLAKLLHFMTALGRGFGGAGVGAAAGDGGDDEFGVTEFRSIWSYCCAGGDDAIGVVVMMPLAVVLIFINGSPGL
ncbi:hypothetical protein F0562_029785 [Nyssa sinensis]|uniref:Uncharacterized protein n=1 Tax=Nyssa sinensis TaxID=561372 RepID=A0A5J5AV14_9ASTE|nr:hypothetical protein F0562_029785 [Nyssa sinensis]